MAPRPLRTALLAVPVTLTLALAATATASQPEPAAGPHPPSSTPDTFDDLPAGAVVADEQVHQVLRVGDRVYAQGYFRNVGRYAGPGQVLSVADGALQESPRIADGQVSVAVGDGAGGWYLGGDFTRIGGHAAGGIAHVLHGGELDTDFLPVADHLVSAMELVGDTLYVGGAFSHVDGVARSRLAAISTEDGSVLPFDAPQTTRVTELLFDPPAGDATGRLLVASDGLSAVDPVTGAAVPGFAASIDAPITALTQGGGHVYVGSDGVVALDPVTGAVDGGFDLGERLAVDVSRAVHTLLYTEDRLYVGSDRTLIQDRPGRLVAVDPETGAIDASFAPDIPTDSTLAHLPSGVYDLALNGDELWAGGSFRDGLTVVDVATGAPVEIDLPAYNLQVNAVDQAAGSMYVGGHFFMTDAVRTRGLAAFDAETLDPVPGFRAADGTYGDLFHGAGALWVADTHHWGYDPSQTAAQTDTYFHDWTSDVVAIDLESGEQIAERTVRVKNLTGITTIGNRLYVARRLQNDVPFPRNQIDVYGPSGKRLDSFRVKQRGYITQLSAIDGDLVLAGSFRLRIGVSAMVKINPENGRRRAYFDPHVNGPVYDVERSRGGLVATGLFKKVDADFSTTNRPGMTWMDGGSHKDTRFAPQSFQGNRVLVHVHALGDLLWVDGSSREFLDARTGKEVANPTGWDTPWWVTGTADDLTYTSLIYPNLGGRTGFKLGFLANAG